MREVLEAALEAEERGEPAALVTVVSTKGSTPQKAGARMLVRGDGRLVGTIGGGCLEAEMTRRARQAISDRRVQLASYDLTPTEAGEDGLVCGGTMQVFIEPVEGTPVLCLFGAGHVGSTLVPILQQLPCRLHWVDSRESFEQQTLPANVTTVLSEAPAMEVAQMPPGSWFIIMTHNHQLDYEILRAVLDRGDAAYVGMIGSATKWRRFQMRLQHQGYSPDVCDTVHCPIGLDTVPGKRPIEVAVSVAAEIIGLYNQSTTRRSTQRGPARLDLQQLVANLTAGESV